MNKPLDLLYKQYILTKKVIAHIHEGDENGSDEYWKYVDKQINLDDEILALLNADEEYKHKLIGFNKGMEAGEDKR